MATMLLPSIPLLWAVLICELVGFDLPGRTRSTASLALRIGFGYVSNGVQSRPLLEVRVLPPVFGAVESCVRDGDECQMNVSGTEDFLLPRSASFS